MCTRKRPHKNQPISQQKLHQRQTCRSTYCHESNKTKYPKKKQIPSPVKCLYWGLLQLAQSKGSQDCKHLLVVHEACFAKPKEFKRIWIEGLTGKSARVTNWPWILTAQLCSTLAYRLIIMWVNLQISWLLFLKNWTCSSKAFILFPVWTKDLNFKARLALLPFSSKLFNF